jgi:hypothetical protein
MRTRGTTIAFSGGLIVLLGMAMVTPAHGTTS